MKLFTPFLCLTAAFWDEARAEADVQKCMGIFACTQEHGFVCTNQVTAIATECVLVSTHLCNSGYKQMVPNEADQLCQSVKFICFIG